LIDSLIASLIFVDCLPHQVGKDDLSEIFVALTAVSAAEEHAAVHAPPPAEDNTSGLPNMDTSGLPYMDTSAPLPWWCDVAGEGCKRPTEPTSLEQYAAEDRCWAFGSTYMVCEVCVGSAEAMHPGPLVELRSPSILGNSPRLGSKWGRALARGAVRMARLKREAEEEETCLIEALMDADRLHDAGYESAEQYSHVLEQVYACKTDVFELLRTRLDAVQARLGGIKGG